jgi:uncharacterized RDD family membrane protein YckC
MGLLRIPTTQNVTLEYETASVGERIAATLIDWVVMAGWVILWALVLFAWLDLDRLNYEDLATILGMALIALPLFLYHLVSEVFFRGQSIGKRWMQIRVISMTGAPPRFTQYLLRWALRTVDNFLYGIVAIACILGGGRGQRLGDLAANTAVVRVKPRQNRAANHLFAAAQDPNYRVTFPEVVSLSDHDVRLVQELVTQSEQRGAYHILADVARRVRTITGVQTAMPDHEFLLVVLRDYSHLAAQTAEQ